MMPLNSVLTVRSSFAQDTKRSVILLPTNIQSVWLSINSVALINCFQFHSELHTSHVTIAVDERERQAAVEKRRNCSRHIDSPITQACFACLQPFCEQCIPQSELCENGLSASFCIGKAVYMRSDTD